MRASLCGARREPKSGAPVKYQRPPRGRRPLRQGERRRGWNSPAEGVRAARAISFRVQSRRGDGRPHVAHSGRRLRREVLRRAARDAPRRARSRRCRGSSRRPRPRGRRRRLPARRRARDRVHGRLLPSTRRRPAHVRRHRRDERAERRLRDGWPTPARALGRSVPGGAPGRGARRRAVRRGRACSRSGRHPRRRAHDPRHGAEVRARRRRHGASAADLVEGGGTTGRRPVPHQALWERGSSCRRGETESHPQERSRRRSSRCSS